MNYDSSREIIAHIMSEKFSYKGVDIVNLSYLRELCMLYYNMFVQKFLPDSQVLQVQLKARRDAKHSAKYVKKGKIHYIVYNPYVLTAMAGASEVIIDGKRVDSIEQAVCAITEHELTHMAERVLYGKTAHGKSFKLLRYKLFGTDVRRPCNYKIKDGMCEVNYPFKVGDKVKFVLKDGMVLYGVIERIVKRATVKIYSSGIYCGKKFYVPLKMLSYI